MNRPEIYFVSNGEKIETFDFGVVPAGTIKKASIEVHNSGDYELTDLNFTFSHPEVIIVSSPKKISPNNFGLLVIEYSPTEQSEHGLRNLEISVSGKYVV